MGFVSNLKQKLSQTKDNHFLALELGSRTIKALIVKASEGKGYIIGAGTQDLTFEQTAKGQIRHIQSVAESVDIAIDKAIQLAGIRPKYAVINPVSPDITHQIQKIVYHREKPKTKINRAELTAIFSNINLKLSNKFKRDHDGYEMLNSIILDAQIDNTAVKNPLDFTGHELSFLVYQSYLPLIQLGAFQSVVDELKLNSAGFVSQPYAIFRAFNPQSFQYKNSLFIDIGGAVTEIIYCRDSQLSQIRTIDIGGDYFTNKLAESLDVSSGKAEQYKKDYVDGLLTADTETDLHNLFMDLSQDWLAAIEEVIDKLDWPDTPPKLYLSGGGSLLPEITSTLETSEGLAECRLNQIHAVDIEKIIDKTNSVNHPTYISVLALAHTGLTYNQSANQISSLYQKFIQTLRT